MRRRRTDQKDNIEEENDRIIVLPYQSSSSSSSSHTDSRICRRGGRAAQCPPLVVAPAHGTLQLVPLRHTSAPPIRCVAQSSASSNSSSREMRRPSSNATISSDFLRKPVQITADPRVYKGSVFANRRLAHDKVSFYGLFLNFVL